MSILNKVMRVAGRDEQGRTKPLQTDDEGKLKVKVDGMSGDLSSSMKAIDIDSGELKTVSAISDDQGEYVLRVVDAAPFLVEVSRFDEARNGEVLIAPMHVNLLPFNANRKFVAVSNMSDHIAYLSFGKEASKGMGIPILPKQTYEMSAMRGNLFKGEINAASNAEVMNLFDKSNIEQGGLLLTGHTTSLTRTRSYPIPVEPNTTYTILVKSNKVRIRSILDYSTQNSVSNGRYLLTDTVVTSCTFTTNSDAVVAAISFCKENITENLTVQETKDAEIYLVKNEEKLIITEGV